MNKLTKGSIAAAAAVALLLGGAGTFATWNAQAAIQAPANISAGTLSISAANSSDKWTSNGNDVKDIASYAIVPGDTLVYTKTLDVVATGDNLAATLSFSGGSIAANDSKIAADVELQKVLLAHATLNIDGNGVKDNGNGTYAIAKGTTAVNLTATLVYPSDSDNAAMSGKVKLTGMTVELNQN